MKDASPCPKNESRDTAKDRKPYKPPSLVRLGTIEEITKGHGTIGGDGMSGNGS
jgi:hypothetical protein